MLRPIVCALLLASSAPLRLAAADVAIHADGRREDVSDPRKDSQGRWMVTIDGHRTPLQLGEVAALVDDKGKETLTLPSLSDAPKTPAQDELLRQLYDPKNDTWTTIADQLASPPSRAVMQELVAAAKDGKKDARARAIAALARMHTTDSSLAAAQAVLAEKDARARRELASVLFSVQEILRRCDSKDVVAAGVADKDVGVRLAFALLSPHDMEAATAVLRTEGLKSGDHHVRESSAVELGERGDASGMDVLQSMLERSKIPGLGCDPDLAERLLIREQVDVCQILGKLGGDQARTALRKATSSPHEPVRKAAETALALVS